MKITASRLERMDLCPGSLVAENGMPERTSDLADSGRRIHAALSCYWRKETYTELLSEAEESLVFGYINETQHLLEERGEDHALFVEERIASADGYSGQPDLVAVWHSDKRALILDWKSGWLEQESSASNLQLRAYAVLVALKHSIPVVEVALLQRNAATIVTRYETEDIIKSREQIIRIIRDATAPGAMRTAGERQCRYCKAVGVCPEARESISATLAIAQNGSAIPIHTTITPATAKQVAVLLTGRQLAEIRDKKRVVELVFEAVDDEIRLRLGEDPASVPGWALKPGNKRRSIKDAAAAYLAVNDVMNASDFLSCCTARLGELEAAFKKATDMDKAAADRTLDGLLRPVIEVTQNDPSIVRAK